MAKRHDKTYGNIRFSRKTTEQYVVLLDTAAWSSFIRKDDPYKYVGKIKLSCNLNVRDANNRKMNTRGTINLSIEVGNRFEMVKFKVVEALVTNILLGCDYCDRHIEYIKPKQRTM